MGIATRSSTRDRLLDAAQELINTQGFAATSIDRIIERVGVTKGAFFYHFKTKQDLAQALIERYAALDRDVLRSSLERAEKLSDDPLQQLLIFVGLLVELGEALDREPQPCCLFATYCFEADLFGEATRAVIADGMREWQRAIGEKLQSVAERYPPHVPVDLAGLAEMLTVLLEGTFVVARARPGRGVFVAQTGHFRTYLKLLFGGPRAAATEPTARP